MRSECYKEFSWLILCTLGSKVSCKAKKQILAKIEKEMSIGSKLLFCVSFDGGKMRPGLGPLVSVLWRQRPDSGGRSSGIAADSPETEIRLKISKTRAMQCYYFCVLLLTTCSANLAELCTFEVLLYRRLRSSYIIDRVDGIILKL